MSLSSFSKAKDEMVKTNIEKTIENNNVKQLVNNIAFKNNVKEDKRPVSFSLTNTQLKKLEDKAHENDFKNRSEFLSALIDEL